jgi:copper transport protein
MGTARTLALLTAVLTAALGVLVLLNVTPAHAHAVLVSTDPPDGATLDAAPEQVTVTFSEPITPPDGALRVYDSSGERVDGADAHVPDDAPESVVATLDAGLPQGTYVVAWRAISDDGHPIRGAFLFGVGEDVTFDEGLLAQITAGTEERVVGVVAALSRGLTYATTLLASGAAAFLVLVAGPTHRRRPDLRRVCVGAAVTGIVVSLLAIPLQTALETGVGLEAFVRGDLLWTTLDGNYGWSVAVRTAGLAAVAISAAGPAFTRSWSPPTAGAGASAAIASFLLIGHTVTTQPRWLVVTSDAVHLAGAALWFGGLVLLAAYLRRPDDPPDEAAGIVARFSRTAMTAVIAVAAGGLALAWAEVRVPRALFGTAYGMTLIVKVVLVAVVLTVGAYNNRRLVPAVVTRDREEGASRAWSQLSRTVRAEGALLVLVLLVTGALVYIQPAREAAGVTGVFSTYEDVGDDHEVNLVVDPNRAGRNELHLYVTHRETFRPLSTLEADLHLEIEMPTEDVGPIEREPRVAGPGHWLHAGDELAFPGTWRVVVVVRLDEFEEVRTTIDVPVNP